MKKREIVFNKYVGHCAYCGEKITLKNFQVDHIVPKYRGGDSHIDNLNPSCRSCNRAKATFLIEEFRELIMRKVKTVRRSNANFTLLERYGVIKQIKTEVKFYFEDSNG